MSRSQKVKMCLFKRGSKRERKRKRERERCFEREREMATRR